MGYGFAAKRGQRASAGKQNIVNPLPLGDAGGSFIEMQHLGASCTPHCPSHIPFQSKEIANSLSQPLHIAERGQTATRLVYQIGVPAHVCGNDRDTHRQRLLYGAGKPFLL